MKLLGAVAVAAAISVMAQTAYADELNLLESYEYADWQGDGLVFDGASRAVYFNSGDGKRQSALEIAAAGTGIYFSVDIGNGVNTSDSGYCTLEFCGEDGEVLSSVSTGSIKGFENYSRFYIGSEGRYYPLPEGTEKVTVSIYAEGSSDKVNVYFRNFTLFFSSEKPFTEAEAYMSSIPGLSKVEVGLNPWVKWLWVGVIFAVALVFYFVRKMMDKYKSPEIMKAGKRKNR